SSTLAPPPQASVLANGSSSLSPEQLQRWIQSVSKDQAVEVVSLSRPSAGGLGFSVATLRSEGTQRGFFIKHIQPGGVAHRDGRLKEMDRILVINGSPLEPEVSQQQALTLLQQPAPTVELLVARDRPSPQQATPTAGAETSGVVGEDAVPNSVADKYDTPRLLLEYKEKEERMRSRTTDGGGGEEEEGQNNQRRRRRREGGGGGGGGEEEEEEVFQWRSGLASSSKTFSSSMLSQL
ncbi:hypothetical protein CRUP_030693, partial [Coryphaenoides rupestris]